MQSKSLIANLISLFVLLVGCSKSDTTPPNYNDNPKLKNIWMMSRGNVGWFVMEYQNTGKKPIRAFEGSWITVDDLDNEKDSLSYSYTSDTPFITKNGIEMTHSISTNETICLVVLHGLNGEERTFATKKESAPATVDLTTKDFDEARYTGKIKYLISKEVDVE
jgi:hypothetical protein